MLVPALGCSMQPKASREAGSQLFVACKERETSRTVMELGKRGVDPQLHLSLENPFMARERRPILGKKNMSL